MEMCTYLIEQGVNVNFKNYDQKTPLHIVALYGQVKCMNLLLKAKADPNLRDNLKNTPLYLAAGYGNHYCSQGYSLMDIDSGCYDDFTIYSVPKTEYLNCIQLLLDNGADVNSLANCNRTALNKFIATRYEFADCVRLLLNRGAAINIQSSEHGYTPLHISADNGIEVCVRLLLERATKTDTQAYCYKHHTPKQIAEGKQYKNIVYLFRNPYPSVKHAK